MKTPLIVLFCAIGLAGHAQEQLSDAPPPEPAPVPVPAPRPVAAPAAVWTPPPTVFPALNSVYDRLQARKAAWKLPLSLGAWHWWHAAPDGKLSYGDTGAEGTFFYVLKADPTSQLAGDLFKSTGIHTEIRFNDGDKFRGFFDSHLWVYEAYAWAYSDLGTIKLGKIWKRFGQDWDGSFWGGTAYYDGFKLNPDWGLSWERQIELGSAFSLSTHAQFFFREDGINGALGYADPESIPGFTRRNTGLLRAALTYRANSKTSFDAGLSGEIGRVASERLDVADQQISGWAFDAGMRYTIRPNLKLRAFGEWMESVGVRSPYRYVSGGASNRLVNTNLGVQLIHGPVSYRSQVSLGRDYNPAGKQKITIHGVTVALAKNVDLYLERVRWTVRPGYTDTDLVFNDGWELVLNWRL